MNSKLIKDYKSIKLLEESIKVTVYSLVLDRQNRLLMWLTSVKYLATHMIARALSATILEHWPRNTPWQSPGVSHTSTPPKMVPWHSWQWFLIWTKDQATKSRDKCECFKLKNLHSKRNKLVKRQPTGEKKMANH